MEFSIGMYIKVVGGGMVIFTRIDLVSAFLDLEGHAWVRHKESFGMVGFVNIVRDLYMVPARGMYVCMYSCRSAGILELSITWIVTSMSIIL